MTVYDVKDGTLSPFLHSEWTAAPDIFLDNGEYKLGLGTVDNGNGVCPSVWVEDTNSTGPWEFTFKIGSPGGSIEFTFLCDIDWNTYMNLLFRVRDDYSTYGIFLTDSSSNPVITEYMSLEPDTEYNVQITKSGNDYEIFLDGSSIGFGTSPTTSFTPEIVCFYVSTVPGSNVILEEIKVGEASAQQNQTIRPSTISTNFSCPNATVVGNTTVINLNLASGSIEVWDFSTDLCGWSKVRGEDYISVENGKVKFSGSEYGAWTEITLPSERNIGVWEYDVEIPLDWAAAFYLAPIKPNSENYTNSYRAWIPGYVERDVILFEYVSGGTQYNPLVIDLLSDTFAGRSGTMTVRLEIDKNAASMFIDDVQLGEPYLNPPETTSSLMSITAKARWDYPIYLDEARYITAFEIPKTVYSLNEPSIHAGSGTLLFVDEFDDNVLDSCWESNGGTITEDNGVVSFIGNHADWYPPGDIYDGPMLLLRDIESGESEWKVKLNYENLDFTISGLIIWADQDNAVSISRYRCDYYCNPYSGICIHGFVNKSDYIHAYTDISTNPVWFKITKTDTDYLFQYSTDDQTYTTIHTAAISSLPEFTKIGMIAKTWGGANIITQFDNFTAASLKPPMAIMESIYTNDTPTILTTAHLPLNSTYQLSNPSILAQINTAIDIPINESTYTFMEAIIREGAGVTPNVLNSSFESLIPQIYYGYTLTPTSLYSRYSMRIWEEEEPDMVTIFPRIILKQIKEAIISPIRK